MNKIYLDHSATTPLDPAVLAAMMPFFSDDFGNPGSLHSFGVEAKKAVVEARKNIASFLGCDETEITFTSGGSESDNLAIRGIVESRRGKVEGGSKPHVVTSAFEHKAVLDTVKALEKSGDIEATYVQPGPNGVIQSEDVKAEIKDNTILISIMYVNNEIGTIQPIREIGKLVKKINASRHLLSSTFYPLLFHTDAVQAAEFCPMNVNDLGVDLLTMTAHKIYGPKAIGLLYARKGTPILPEITGGGQERGFRAGTENVPGIVGFAAAVQKIRDPRYLPAVASLQAMQADEIPARSRFAPGDAGGRDTTLLRDKLIDGILNNIPNSILNGDRTHLVPHIANISFVNAEGEAILLNLDFLGIAVSTGSACTSRTLEPSHVLSSMGVRPENAHGSIRFSLGRETTAEEIDQVLEILPGIINKLRAMSPFKS
ncbi:MAG: cysteine desulfurase family protein [Patescibacteria group bacterium]|jgi:cysteine desulfurase